MSPALPSATSSGRFRLFVDFWNLQLTLNEREAKSLGSSDEKFKIDWLTLPTCLVDGAATLVGAKVHSYEGTIIYTSANSKTDEGRKFAGWVTNWLDRQAGIQVELFERHPKSPPKCNVCHKIIAECPHCHDRLAGTIEKGVDTAIATDMIRLAWAGAYDVAILASSDADLVPAVQFLETKGIKVVQAGFPPLGSNLAKACWGAVDVFALRDKFRRSVPN
jgi:uncharacterized LabA/DUF88 family protein